MNTSPAVAQSGSPIDTAYLAGYKAGRRGDEARYSAFHGEVRRAYGEGLCDGCVDRARCVVRK